MDQKDIDDSETRSTWEKPVLEVIGDFDDVAAGSGRGQDGSTSTNS